MRLNTSSTLCICFSVLFMLPMPALAIPAVMCHCFTDRSYEPARPAAADPYFLATTQNAFFALVFNTDKKAIVIKKQLGSASDDLWIAYWVASKSGVSPDTLLQAKQKNETWRNVLLSMQISTKVLGSRFSGGLNAQSSSGQLAESVVDELFITHHLLAEPELAAIRKAGASNQELIIAAVIAAKMRQPASQIFLEVKSGSKSWGSLFTWANIDAKNMQQEILNILKLHPQ